MHWITLFWLQIICKTFLVSSSSLELPLVVHNDLHEAIFHLSSSSRNSTEEFYPSWNHRYIGKIVPVMLVTSIFVTKTRNKSPRHNFKLCLSFTFCVILTGFTLWMFLSPNNLVTWESDVTLEEDCLGKLLNVHDHALYYHTPANKNMLILGLPEINKGIALGTCCANLLIVLIFCGWTAFPIYRYLR